jgi:hypothetical protein
MHLKVSCSFIPPAVKRKYVNLKWLMPGIFLLSLLAIPAYGNGFTIFHLTAVRSELVEIRPWSNVNVITLSKAIHLCSHTHDGWHNEAPVFSHLAARLYSIKAETEAKNTESREPFWVKLLFKIKIPSSGDSDADAH